MTIDSRRDAIVTEASVAAVRLNSPTGRFVSSLSRPIVLLAIYVPPIFLGALLMFWSEMLIGKMVLPLLGGTPMVWTTCMVFFQALLLAGYAYAHWSLRFGLRRQAMVYMALIAISLPLLPIGGDTNWLPPTLSDPRPWLIGWLMLAIGVPFFILSATGPMLQAWFAKTDHPDAVNPYFLYVTSNAGSLIGLLGFPVLAEPLLTINQQTWVWSAVYIVFAALIALVGWTIGKTGNDATRVVPTAMSAADSDAAAPSIYDRVRWVLLAFAPSSLLLGLTSFITTDIAAVPLLWVAPLAAYLITFMIAFAKKPILAHPYAVIFQPLAVFPPLMLWFWDVGRTTFLMMGIHFAAFFITAMVCHGELARTRPSPNHLTGFYLLLALGGVLGGFFNTVIAPLAFSDVVEYPLVLVLALLLRPPAEENDPARRRMDLIVPGAWFLLMLGLQWYARDNIDDDDVDVIAVASIVISLVCFQARLRPVRFGLMAAGLMSATWIVPPPKQETIFTNRNFFGMVRVVDDTDDQARNFYHGTTLHGAQLLDPARRLTPVTYYSEDGPVGQIFRLPQIDRKAARIAVIGLGSGTIACHARQRQAMTFYEIDPAVKRVAEDPRIFTFLKDCPAKSTVVVGDGRLMPRLELDKYFDLIVMDAFSSDAVPVHLLTREAFALYRAKLTSEGVVLVNISNRYLDLSQVLAGLAEDSGMAAFLQDYDAPKGANAVSNSTWVAMAPPGPNLDALASDARWKRIKSKPGQRVWTDSFSNLISTLR